MTGKGNPPLRVSLVRRVKGRKGGREVGRRKEKRRGDQLRRE